MVQGCCTATIEPWASLFQPSGDNEKRKKRRVGGGLRILGEIKDKTSGAWLPGERWKLYAGSDFDPLRTVPSD